MRTQLAQQSSLQRIATLFFISEQYCFSKPQNFEFIMLHLHRTKIVSGCSLLSDAKFVRTGNTLITTEKILSLHFLLNLESYACRRKSTMQSLYQLIFRNAAYVLVVCVYTSHMLC